MKFVPQEHHRRSIRLKGYDYTQPGVPNHIHGLILIIDPARGTAANNKDEDLNITRCAPANRVPANREQFGKPVRGSIPTIIRSFKSAVSLHVNRSRFSSGSPVWQRNYLERVVRDQSELERIRAYIHQNPAQWAENRENL